MKRIVSKEIVEGFWICNHCHTKVPGTVRNCPNCGQPVDKNTSFDVDKENARVLSKEEAKDKGNGANWICPFCDAQNENEDVYCKSCGSPREESKTNYFNRTEKQTKEHSHKAEDMDLYEENGQVQKTFPIKENHLNYSNRTRKSSVGTFIDLNRLKSAAMIIFPILIGIIFLTCFLIHVNTPKSGTIQGFSWNVTQTIEEYKYISDSSWDRPGYGADITDEKQELYGYNKVKVGEETKTRTETRREKVGSHYETEYEDNGDGTFTKITIEVDDYDYVPVEVTYTEPIYENVPIYRTKYYYSEWKWVYSRKEYRNGAGKAVKEPEFTLKNKERIAGTDYTYSINIQDKDGNITTLTCDKELWETLNIGDFIKYKAALGRILTLEVMEKDFKATK